MSEPTVGEQLAIINVKLDLLLVGKDDHESRIRALETKVWKAAGAAAAFSGAIGGALVKFLA